MSTFSDLKLYFYETPALKYLFLTVITTCEISNTNRLVTYLVKIKGQA